MKIYWNGEIREYRGGSYKPAHQYSKCLDCGMVSGYKCLKYDRELVFSNEKEDCPRWCDKHPGTEQLNLFE